jgi:anti-sigma regulatory factor (Ser/Thr protein kinase)
MRTNLNVAPRLQVSCSPDGEKVVRTEDRPCDGRLDVSAQAGRTQREVVGASPPGGPGSGAQGAVRTFPLSRDAPAAARHFAVGALRRWGIAGLADDVALVVTELAANAVRHARSGFTVILSRPSRPSRPDVVRVSVRDASPLPPSDVSGSGSPLPVTPLHGLGAVNAMASHWGVQPLGSSGKTVWVELHG